MPLRLRASPSRRRALSAGQRKTSLQLLAVSFQQKGTRGVVYQGTASAVLREIPLYSVTPSEAGLFASEWSSVVEELALRREAQAALILRQCPTPFPN